MWSPSPGWDPSVPTTLWLTASRLHDVFAGTRQRGRHRRLAVGDAAVVGRQPLGDQDAQAGPLQPARGGARAAAGSGTRRPLRTTRSIPGVLRRPRAGRRHRGREAVVERARRPRPPRPRRRAPAPRRGSPRAGRGRPSDRRRARPGRRRPPARSPPDPRRSPACAGRRARDGVEQAAGAGGGAASARRAQPRDRAPGAGIDAAVESRRDRGLLRRRGPRPARRRPSARARGGRLAAGHAHRPQVRRPGATRARSPTRISPPQIVPSVP